MVPPLATGTTLPIAQLPMSKACYIQYRRRWEILRGTIFILGGDVATFDVGGGAVRATVSGGSYTLAI